MRKTKFRKQLRNPRGPKLGRIDPTRTITLRRAFAAKVRKAFDSLKVDVIRLVVDEDAFGLRHRAPFKPPHLAANVFCATGEGGGTDPSCSPGSSFISRSEIRKDGKFQIHLRDPRKPDEFAGFIVLREREDGNYETHKIEVSEEHQRKGLGARLYAEANEWVKSKGKSLHVSDDAGPDAKALHRRLMDAGKLDPSGKVFNAEQSRDEKVQELSEGRSVVHKAPASPSWGVVDQHGKVLPVYHPVTGMRHGHHIYPNKKTAEKTLAFLAGKDNLSANAECNPPDLLPAPDERQPNHFWCGASCFTSALKTFGVEMDVERAAKILHTTLARSTAPSAVVAALPQFQGLEFEERHGMTFDDLSECHRRGQVVMCPVQDYGSRRERGASFAYGHWLLVIGTGFGRVFCQDSSHDNVERIPSTKVTPGGDVKGKQDPTNENISEPGRIMVLREEWDRVWHDKDFEGKVYDHCGIIIGSRTSRQQWGVTSLPSGETQGSLDEEGGAEVARGTAGQGGHAVANASSLVFQEEFPGGPSCWLDRTTGAQWEVTANFDPMRNTFCPTGEGGGIDPSCPPEFSEKEKEQAKSFREKAFRDLKAVQDRRAKIGRMGIPDDARLGTAQQDVDDATERARRAKAWHYHVAFGAIRPKEGRPTMNVRWAFESDPEKAKAFAEWLRSKIRVKISNDEIDRLWQKYAEAGWRKGASRAFDDSRGAERALAEANQKLDFYDGTREQFLRSAFGRPVAIDKIKLLAGRSLSDLAGVTSDMATRMIRLLTDGLVEGSNPREIGRDLAKAVDIGKGRALTIARTEIIRTHAEGQLDAFEELGVDEVGVAVEWATADDDAVCELCDDLDGVVLSVEEAHNLLPRHPS